MTQSLEPHANILNNESVADDHPTPGVIVRFRVPAPKVVYKAHPSLALHRHDTVIVEGQDGDVATATVLRGASEIETQHATGRVVRIATEHDARTSERSHQREREAFTFCQERIRTLDLPMKLVAVEMAHSGQRAIFSFSSAERVDFRVLVKELARRFHTRIEMRQIGIRDAARYVGGIGICGQRTCCSTFLPEFKPISIRMAKDQGLSLNHQKLSGVCGRLRCCLQYEQSTYQEQRQSLPKVGKRVHTPQGDGRVKDMDVLRRRVRVALTAGGMVELDAAQIQPWSASESTPATTHSHPAPSTASAAPARPSNVTSTPRVPSEKTTATSPSAPSSRRRRRRKRQQDKPQ